MWKKIDNGLTPGSAGSEGGSIVLDEEFEDLARITLEKDCDVAPWCITCGIYGGFMHTVFVSTQAESKKKIDRMKVEIVAIIEDEDRKSRYEKIDKFVNTY